MIDRHEDGIAEPQDAASALTPDEALALLRGSEADYQAGDLAAAKAASETLVAANRFVEWANFFLGRIYRDEADDEAAIAAFSAAIDADAGMFWAHCERLMLARKTGASSEHQSELVDAMVAIAWQPLEGGNLHNVELIAHAQWDDGRIANAHAIFEKLWPSPGLDVLTLIRIVEADLDTDLVAGAIARLEQTPDLDETALRILIQHNEIQDDSDKQIALIDSRVLSSALQTRAWSSIAKSYARRRRQLATTGASDQPAEDAALVARLDDFARSVAEADTGPLSDEQIPQMESIANVLWDEGHTDSAHRLFARMWPSDHIGQITLIRIVEADLDAELVAGAIERLEETPDLDETALRILIQHNEIQDDSDRQIALIDSRVLSAALQTRAWSSIAKSYARRHRQLATTGASDQPAEDAALVARLDDFARSVAEADTGPLPDGQIPQVESIANVLWDEGHTDSAHRLFARMWPSDHLRPLTLVRIVEADRDAAMIAEAVERLEALSGIDDTALRVLADHHSRQGDVGREIALLERRRGAIPADFQAWIALARSYAKKGDRDRAMATLDQNEAFDLRQRTFARLIVLVELGDANSALLDLRTLARLYDEVPKYPGIRIAYLLGDAYDVVGRDEVLTLLSVHCPDDSDIALVRVNVAIRDQRWADARTLFDAHLAELEPQSQNVRLANIDILAFSGQLEAAQALLDLESANGVVSSGFLRSRLRILGELERWDEVFALGLDHIREDASFEHFFAIMIRAARKTGRSRNLFDALVGLAGPLNSTQRDALFAVMEDLAEAGHHDILDRIDAITIPYEREHRIRSKLNAAHAPVETTRDLCIYYCADQTYLMPALVSLTALAMSNVSVARRAVFYLVVDSDVVAQATEAGSAIARRLDFTLEVVDASTIVSSADRLRTSYGMFTGGQQLALAAYYRIFFARHLAAQGKFAQALYVDADTIVRGGLEELFAMEHSAPIMARYETDRPEVRHATEVHQLKGRYFNSGVLHFDLAHPDLPALLDRAIAAAIDPEVNLIFQDQCALNIAFDLQMSELPARFNYFSPPSLPGDGIAATDAVIVHFLDRPKPWDSLYRHAAREWFEWFDLVESLRQSGASAAE